MTTLAEIALRHALSRPESVAFSFQGRDTTFALFDRRTNQVANALVATGVAPGHRVAYLGKNSDRYFEIFFGAAKAGAVMTPIGWRLAPAEAAAILEDCGARVVFVGPDATGQANAALACLANRPSVIAIDDASIQSATSFDMWREVAPMDAPQVEIRPDDVALQVYTSGTTGRPKGVMLTHENLLAKHRELTRAQMDWYRWTPDDVSLVAMPVAHVGGSLWGIAGLLHGAKGVIAHEFDPLTVLDFIERDRISKMFMVPSALQIVVRQPRSREVNFGRLKYILYGASPIPLDLLRECMDVFGCGFCQQYGMTETAGAIAYLPPEDHDPNGNPRMRAAGLPMPGVEIKIVDSLGNALPPHTVGEIVTRSCGNMAGYWRMPEATSATVDPDGWLRTGDAGYLDESGYLYIHDRVKDMIISGAENIYPAEVENAIYGHPGVAEVAVIGVPDEKWGEAVKAVIVLKPGAVANVEDILKFARTRIAGFKVPKSIDFVEALPRNASGKILRRQLQEQYWAGRMRKVN
ncbi:fatty acid--CoA ligase [Paraburkholderia madseniana]|uniref:Fatty acid--CoA ligase n=1 Tax=Paraburkholderia madseniana TaxID=2599607 RepID=A0AAP5BKH3_9BURK|nr:MULTISPECIES: fatty acid--CoA ligase [Paraburkholderia]MCX4149651.1 fatty acid--CoA ligase [Paraburkholderia madseniana]MDN7152587.1 fatty acid--CoA ligase [Paraburkholderia sp. WS6]MDQ6411469.1 fatty acid--CoA ligase [Paraburkholderia madseniana]